MKWARKLCFAWALLLLSSWLYSQDAPADSLESMRALSTKITGDLGNLKQLANSYKKINQDLIDASRISTAKYSELQLNSQAQIVTLTNSLTALQESLASTSKQLSDSLANEIKSQQKLKTRGRIILVLALYALFTLLCKIVMSVLRARGAKLPEWLLLWG
jgi:CHASE3 domain sensor protein